MIKAEWTNKDALDLQPTCNQLATNAEPKTGEWVEHIGGISHELYYFCDQCYGEVDTNDYDFCPWCGARVRGEEE